MAADLDARRKSEDPSDDDYPAYVPSDITDEDSLERLMDYVEGGMTDEQRQALDADPDIQRVEDLMAQNPDAFLTEKDLKDLIITDEDGDVVVSPEEIVEAGTFADLRGHDAFPDDYEGEDSISSNTDGDDAKKRMFYPKGITKDQLVEMDDLLTDYKKSRAQLDDQTYFGADHDFAYMDVERDWNALANETQDEIMEVIETSETMASPEPEMWLMYDLKFNVTNLILVS